MVIVSDMWILDKLKLDYGLTQVIPGGQSDVNKRSLVDQRSRSDATVDDSKIEASSCEVPNPAHNHILL